MTIIFLCIAGFLAAFVDSIAGGGGLISVPAYYMAGLPSHMALGTNKFSATCASLTSSIKYLKSGHTNKKLLKYALPFTFIGACIGVTTALQINEKALSSIILVMVMIIGVYSLFSKSVGMKENLKTVNSKRIILLVILAVTLGFYDGFFGPGTGSFLIFGLIHIFGFEFKRAGANARVMNFVSNIASLFLYAINMKINLYYGIPVAIFSILGARLGTSFALKKGAKVIKPIFVTMSLLLSLKLLLVDVLKLL
ncbi:sulfite exporter TauE/SafE family protein [Oceanirhabdus sp. W0125-5]|uniref:sulfite exporter TauE/SafE family protein n=1 Tax=Oceanirhabdus sp. W0125-5 TaxID=2999116 RepID=UPI0022F2FDED|nr:TSUP family transporter [Oceanirhabdus sp. W0125-5]WBW95710.1 TSUP family transporter [Oceanirhabdus sp. W0125-5]